MDFLEATDVEALEEEMALAALVSAAASGGGDEAAAAADLEKQTATEAATEGRGGGEEVAELEAGGQTQRETGLFEAATGRSGELEAEIPGRGGQGDGGARGLTEDGSLLHTERSQAAPKHNGLTPYGTGFSSSGLMPESRSLATCQSGLKGLTQGAGKCVTCGKGGEGRMLHRLKQQGVLQHHCSSCILFYNKGMYCSVCFQVYSDCNQLGDPALWLTCCKCQRLSHLECVRNHGSPSSSPNFASFICSDCTLTNRKTEASMSQVTVGVNLNMEVLCTGSSGDANDPPRVCIEPPNKKLRMSCEAGDKTHGADDTGSQHMEICTPKQSDLDHKEFSSNVRLFDQETLAAAKIVAALTAKEAVVAKAKAIATAAVAVKAAARAKAALDAAFWAGKEEAKFKAHATRHFSVMSGGLPSSQGFGASMIKMRKMEKGETRVGRDGSISQLPQTLTRVEEHTRHLQEATNGFYKNSRVGTAVHKRRKLSAIAASEASRTGDSDVALQETVAPMKQQQILPELTYVQTAHHGSSTPVHDVAEQSDEGLQRHVISLARSEGLLTGALQTSTPDSDEIKHHGGLSPVHEVIEHIHEKLKQHILSFSDSEALQTGSFQTDIPSADQSYKDLGQHVYFLADSEGFLTGSLQTSTPGSEEDLRHETLNSVYAVAEQSHA